MKIQKHVWFEGLFSNQYPEMYSISWFNHTFSELIWNKMCLQYTKIDDPVTHIFARQLCNMLCYAFGDDWERDTGKINRPQKCSRHIVWILECWLWNYYTTDSDSCDKLACEGLTLEKYGKIETFIAPSTLITLKLGGETRSRFIA